MATEKWLLGLQIPMKWDIAESYCHSDVVILRSNATKNLRPSGSCTVCGRSMTAPTSSESRSWIFVGAITDRPFGVNIPYTGFLASARNDKSVRSYHSEERSDEESPSFHFSHRFRAVNDRPYKL